VTHPNEKGRPGEKAAHSKSLAGDDSNPSRLHRRYWAQQLLDAGGGWPIYGSPEWCALQVDDPRRVAACVAAAEIYTRDWYDNLEERLRGEVDEARTAHKRAEDEEYVRQAAEHRAYWSRKSGKVVSMSFEERRKQQLAEASMPRPGDFTGRNGDVS
jgi:hypothetical protein